MRRPDLQADVVVVGGGVIGCSLAYELAKRGLSVALTERDTLASHSTGKNAGGVRQQFSLETTVRMQMLSLRLLESFEEELGVSAGLKRIGYLFVLTNDVDAAAFAAHFELWRRVGLAEARWLAPREVSELAPAIEGDDVIAGTFCPSDGIASPVDVTYGYASGARRLGVEILEHSQLTSFDLINGAIAGVETTTARIACDAVFICAGAWSRGVGALAGVDIPVEPHRRHICLAGPVQGVDPHTPMTVDFATSFYFHPEGEGVLFGMSDRLAKPGFDTSPDPAFLEAVSMVVSRRAPAFLEAEVRTCWAGLYEMTPDFQPVLGAIEAVDGLWCACGFSGHGFMQAPAVALLLAQQFTGAEPLLDLSPFSHQRFSHQQLACETAVI